MQLTYNETEIKEQINFVKQEITKIFIKMWEMKTINDISKKCNKCALFGDYNKQDNMVEENEFIKTKENKNQNNYKLQELRDIC